MTIARLTRYAIYGAGLGCTALALAGFATFDPVTGQIDPAPFNVYTLIQGAGNALAFVALALGWGRK